MKTETKRRIKLALRRFTLRWLRKLVDVADDRLHAAEVKLRGEVAAKNSSDGQGFVTIVELNRDAQRPQAVDEPFLSAQDKAGNCPTVTDETAQETPIRGTTFQQWEARRSGIAPITKKAARQRRQRMTASAFDLKYAR
jgi:hypothetical protein